MNLSSKKAVLLDFDGVIAHTAPAIRQAMWAFLRKKHIQAVESDFEDNGNFTKSLKQLVISLKEKYGYDIDVEDMRNATLPMQLELLDKHCEFDPSLMVFLKYCNQAGIKLAIGSNSFIDRIRWVIQKMRIEKYFLLDEQLPEKGYAIISATDLTEHKPNPEVWLRCAAMWQVSPDQCLVIEDGLPGLQGAKTCGATGIYYQRFCRPDRACEELAAHSVKSFSELL